MDSYALIGHYLLNNAAGKQLPMNYEPKDHALLITAKIIAITAITNNTWINPPAE